MMPRSFQIGIPGKLEMTFLDYGGIIWKLMVPDKNAKLDDMVLGFPSPEDYLRPHPYFGALIGRYANRIAGGLFRLSGKLYQLPLNDGQNSLHGGGEGFDRRHWAVEVAHNSESAKLSLVDPDGRQGYPGNLKVEVKYEVTANSELIISYLAMTDAPTPLNLTSHCYFNLAGSASRSIRDHELWINADEYTETDERLIPTGKILAVEGAMDFRTPRNIGDALTQVPTGFDHNFVLRRTSLTEPKARLHHRSSGRTLEVFTTEPGLQFYSGNFLDGKITGKLGKAYPAHSGLCLETQHYPDSLRHAQFPSTVLNPGETFLSRTSYKFSVSSSQQNPTGGELSR